MDSCSMKNGIKKEEVETEEDKIAKIKDEVLLDKYDKICQYLEPSRHFPTMRSRRALDYDDCQLIESEKTSRDRSRRFVDILRTKGPAGYDAFMAALLADRTQIFLLKMLNMAYEEKVRALALTEKEDTARESTTSSMSIHDLPKPGEDGGPRLP